MATFIKQTLDNGEEAIVNLDHVVNLRKQPNGDGGFIYTILLVTVQFPYQITEEVYNKYAALVSQI